MSLLATAGPEDHCLSESVLGGTAIHVAAQAGRAGSSDGSLFIVRKPSYLFPTSVLLLWNVKITLIHDNKICTNVNTQDPRYGMALQEGLC